MRPQLVPVDWRKVPTSPTSFGICVIRDEEFSPEPMVLFVHNMPDKRTDENTGEVKNFGKPPGFGMPGGGLNVEEMDTITSAARREISAETGLSEIGLTVNPLFAEHKVIISDKRTGELLREIPYEKGKRPSITIDPKHETALDNPIHVFSARVGWANSKLREFFLECRDSYVKSGQLSTEALRTDGLYFMDLESEEYQRLGIVEKDEIDGMCLLPIGRIKAMIIDSNYYIDDIYFYVRHLARIRRGLSMMNLLA